MKIQKFWVSDSIVSDVERKLIDISNSVEFFLIDTDNIGEYSDESLLNNRLYLNSCVLESEDLALAYKSFFWFCPDMHPDYCAVISRVDLINKAICDEIIARQNERKKYRRH